MWPADGTEILMSAVQSKVFVVEQVRDRWGDLHPVVCKECHRIQATPWFLPPSKTSPFSIFDSFSFLSFVLSYLFINYDNSTFKVALSGLYGEVRGVRGMPWRGQAPLLRDRVGLRRRWQ